MKKPISKSLSLALGLAMLAGAGSANAVDPGVKSTPEFPNYIVGSDTLNVVIRGLVLGDSALGIPALPLTQINFYADLGSSAGEVAMEGSPTTGQPTCLPTDANGVPDTNPGCQEIAPMSRAMDSSICEDTESTGEAESLVIAKDGIVIVTDNRAYQRFSNGACAANPAADTPNGAAGEVFPAANAVDSGFLKSSGAISPQPASGAYALTDWKDVLRVIYTGCLNNQGTCDTDPGSAVVMSNRRARCSSDVREALISNWANIFTGTTDCASGTCATGLRQAYRRDDSSGTTQFFLEILGVGVAVALTRAPTAGIYLGGNINTIPNHSFCDGGQNEGFFQARNTDVTPAVTEAFGGDPIRRPCQKAASVAGFDDDDLCNYDGNIGVVRAIRSPLTPAELAEAPGASNYPSRQCTRGSFALKPWLNTSIPKMCPDGSNTVGGTCWAPYYNDTATGARDFNCVNDRLSRPSSLPSTTDGRAYNYVVRSTDGNTVAFAASLLPQVASWRQNLGDLDLLPPVNGGTYTAKCQETDATRTIGCLVANTTCTIGYGGRETAGNPAYAAKQEAAHVNGVSPSNTAILGGTYPVARDLYLAAIGGFENVLADCVDRIPSGVPTNTTAYCHDEIKLAAEAYNYTASFQALLRKGSFLPFETDTDGDGNADPICRGATGSAGCGAPTSQSKAACALCGDGVLQTGPGSEEQCDPPLVDGKSPLPTATCSIKCKAL